MHWPTVCCSELHSRRPDGHSAAHTNHLHIHRNVRCARERRRPRTPLAFLIEKGAHSTRLLIDICRTYSTLSIVKQALIQQASVNGPSMRDTAFCCALASRPAIFSSYTPHSPGARWVSTLTQQCRWRHHVKIHGATYTDTHGEYIRATHTFATPRRRRHCWAHAFSAKCQTQNVL